LLATLQKRGLVEQDDETGKYRLGLVVIRLAERAERTLDLRGIALPELERLARLTHETTGLGILDGDSLLSVAQADGPNLIAVGDWTGRATQLHCVASGKVLLSSLAEREVLRIVRRGLVSYTERTIVEARAAASRSSPGIGAAVLPPRSANTNWVSMQSPRLSTDARGNVIAAVDIWGPAFRLTPRRIPELAMQAREAAAAISIRLGGRGRPDSRRSVVSSGAQRQTGPPGRRSVVNSGAQRQTDHRAGAPSSILAPSDRPDHRAGAPSSILAPSDRPDHRAGAPSSILAPSDRVRRPSGTLHGFLSKSGIRKAYARRSVPERAGRAPDAVAGRQN